MRPATLDPTAGETARRHSPYVQQPEQVGDPTDPRFHAPRFERVAEEIALPRVAFHTGALTLPRITETHRPEDRPLGSTHHHPGAAFLPADVCGDPPVGHVLGHSRETIVGDRAKTEGRPVGHVVGRKPGQRPAADLGRHPAGHVLGPVPGRSE